MRLELYANTEWGSLFDGIFQLPISFRTAFSSEYFLLFVNLSDGDPIDIFKLLNNAFSCGIEGSLLVDNAGFFVYTSSSPSASLPLGSVFPLIDLPESLLSNELPSENASHFCFWLSINLQNISLFHNLLEIGCDQYNQLIVTCRLTSKKTADPQKAFLETDMSALLPSIKLFKVFDFSNLKLLYSFSQSSSFYLSGLLAISVFDVNCEFSCALSVSDNFISVSAEALRDFNLPSLFGSAMRNISFKKLALSIVYTFGSSSSLLATLSGIVNFAQLSLKGELFLSGTTPVLARILLLQDLSIADLFSQCIPDASWPSDLINLTFKSGSQIYYLSGNLASLPIPQILPYTQGFNIFVKMRFSLFHDFDIDGNISITEKGVAASIRLADPIDLFIIQLSAASETGGPEFGLSTIDGSSMYFYGAISLFNSHCGNVSIACAKDSLGALKVSGSLTLSDDLASVFDNHSNLSFSYSKNDGLVISGFENFGFFYEAAKFVNKLRDYCNNTSPDLCAMLADWICDNAFENLFNISPSISNINGDIWLMLDGTFEFLILGEKVFDIPFPNLTGFKIPNNFSWDSLSNHITGALEDLFESLFDAIINDPDKFALLLGVLLGENALQEALKLLCRYMLNSATAAAAGAAGSAFASAGGAAAGAAAIAKALEALEASRPPLPPNDLSVYFTDTSENILSLSWAAPEGADTYRSALIGDGSVLLTITLSELKSDFIIDKPYPNSSFSLNVIAGKSKYDTWSSPNSLPLDKADPPQNLQSQYSENEGLILLWDPQSLPVVSYTFIFSLNDSYICSRVSPRSSAYTIDLTDPVFLTGGNYSCDVRADHMLSGLSSILTRISWFRLDMPSNLVLGFDAALLVLNWNSVACSASYRIIIDNTRIPDIYSLLSSETSISINLPLNFGTGLYNFSVYAIPADSSIIPGAPATLHFTLDSWQLAARAFDQGISAEDCGKLLYDDNPQITQIDLTRSMKDGGFSKTDSAKALLSLWPEISSAELLHLLSQAYGYPLTLEEIAKKAFEDAKDGAECAAALLSAYPKAASKAIISSMQNAGYSRAQTKDGLIFAFPLYSDSLIEELLLEYYI